MNERLLEACLPLKRFALYDAAEWAGYLAMLRDLVAWVRPRAEFPDMDDLTDEMIGNGWITEAFNLGRTAAQALFELWLEARAQALLAPSRSNAAPAFRAELIALLDAEQDAHWAKAIRLQMLRHA